MSIEIDTRGQACPKPVIMTKNALESMIEGTLLVLTDDPVATANVERFASSAGCTATTQQTDDGTRVVRIIKRVGTAVTPAANSALLTGPMVFLVNSDRLGRGEDELGRILAKAFVFALTESAQKPDTIIFMNSGVRLLVDGSDCVDNLKRLNAAGVAIIGCGTCLDYYGLKDRVQVGTISNMYDIATILTAAAKVVTM